VFLLENNLLLAHVGRSGVLCLNDFQGLSLDLARREDIVADTVVEALGLLERSAEDANRDHVEFFDELEGYWLGLPGAVGAQCAVDEGADRLVRAMRNPKTGGLVFFEKDQNPPWEFLADKLKYTTAAVLRLDQRLNPPLPSEELNGRFLERLVSALTPSQLTLWKRLVQTHRGNSHRVALLLSLPRTQGLRSLVGLTCAFRNGRLDTSVSMTALSVQRHTPAYMRERGGASLANLSKHVVVLGCGSVGSEVADLLATNGVGHLTLVDMDYFSPDNAFRHVLGPVWTGTEKVIGLEYELSRRYPGLKVTASREKAEIWLETANLQGVDGVVLALGLPTTERELVRKLRQMNLRMPLVLTWLDPQDLGGHSLLLQSTGPGCLECTYRDVEGIASLRSRAAFLAPDQKVTKNLTGCGSVFVPYGALQSRRTALLAGEHMLEALDGLRGPSYRFWVGRGSAAEAQGLRPSAWWQLASSTSPEHATRMLFGTPCAHCKEP
jgi:hypothetical protein